MALIIAIDRVPGLISPPFTLGCFHRLAESALEMPEDNEGPQKCDQRRKNVTNLFEGDASLRFRGFEFARKSAANPPQIQCLERKAIQLDGGGAWLAMSAPRGLPGAGLCAGLRLPSGRAAGWRGTGGP